MTARLDESLEMGSLRGSSGAARRSLESLRKSPGYVVLSGSDKAPDRVRIKPWVEVTYWRRVHGGGDGGLYEAEPKTPALVIDQDGEYLGEEVRESNPAEPFCACGRVASMCDGSRAGCGKGPDRCAHGIARSRCVACRRPMKREGGAA